MRSSIKQIPFGWFFGFAFLFALQVIPRIFMESPTYDEPVDITNGYFYWKGDVTTHNFHPPLAKALQALPLLALPLKNTLVLEPKDFQNRVYDFFLVLNPGHMEMMVVWPRCVTLLMGLGVGFLLFIAARGETKIFLLALLSLWAFEPTLLAFSSLAVADVPVTFFFLAAVLAFREHIHNPGKKWAFFAGIIAAMAVTCKYSALVLIPIFALLENFNRRKSGQNGFFRRKAPEWLCGAAAAGLWICFLYLPGTLFLPNPRFPIAYFMDGFSSMAAYQGFHHPTYFLGEASRENHWLYYPAAFLLKSTLPFLILVFLGIFFALRKIVIFPGWIWVPALLGFLCILPVQNLGVRYLLPVYPFLIWIAAKSAERIWAWGIPSSKQLGKILVVGFLAWHAISVLANYPNMISYFNDLVPKNRKIYFLGDSNLDWNQDLKRLVQTARERGWKKAKIPIYGMINPVTYGLPCQAFDEKDLAAPQPGTVYAVNATFIQLGPLLFPGLEPYTRSWLFKIPPTGKVGDTWFYFEIPAVSHPAS